MVHRTLGSVWYKRVEGLQEIYGIGQESISIRVQVPRIAYLCPSPPQLGCLVATCLGISLNQAAQFQPSPLPSRKSD